MIHELEEGFTVESLEVDVLPGISGWRENNFFEKN
jgi:hypothetical protein